jgi:hypothetical protein
MRSVYMGLSVAFLFLAWCFLGRAIWIAVRRSRKQ